MFSDLNVKYIPGKVKDWKGRETTSASGPQYWYQIMECMDLEHSEGLGRADFGIIGYACDEGVRRNFGRVGAKDGPQSFRDKLGGLPHHFEDKSVLDFGNLICIDGDMESCQEAFSKTISLLVSNHIFPIGIGGGHDMAYAHFKGLYNVLRGQDKTIGIINFDAHFDLRPVVDLPNSGTPFYQIIEEQQWASKPSDYFVIGIQRQSNTKELFEIASRNGCGFLYSHDCHDTKAVNSLKKQLRPFIDAHDYLYITIDMDGFSSAYAPGVSAPSCLGFSPEFVFNMLKFLLGTKKVISCDIAELNPKYDTQEQTARLAAKLVDHIVFELSA